MKNYAIVGTGGRHYMFSRAIAKNFGNSARVCALCDVNLPRAELARERLENWGHASVPVFSADRFDEMIRATRPDCVIVTSIDRTHHRYIVRAMEMGCDVITEKPMTTNAERCRQILEAVNRTGRTLRVAFNYRYSPRNARVRELLANQVVGNIRSVHFEWLLDTRHGADYFRRWHRDKRNSGGLLVHKATHHFDLVNWWLGSRPRRVFAMGDLVFYGRENAEERGVTRFYDRGTETPSAAGDPFALDLDADDRLKKLYRDTEHADGYRRDQSVFGDGISIEDDMAVMVSYQSGATMTYHLTAYSPWEGYRVAFNGDGGRLEYEVHENSYISGNSEDMNRADADGAGISEPARVVIRPHWAPPEVIDLSIDIEGGHGGGDARLLDDLFGGEKPDPLGRAAGHMDGAWSVLTGIAANQSMATGEPVDVDRLLAD